MGRQYLTSNQIENFNLFDNERRKEIIEKWKVRMQIPGLLIFMVYFGIKSSFDSLKWI